VNKHSAAIIALCFAAAVLGGCAYFASSVSARAVSNAVVPIAVGALLVTSGLVAYAHSTPKKHKTPPGGGEIGAPDVTVHAFDIGFREKTLSTHSGDVVVEYDNTGGQPHTLVFDGVPAFKIATNGGAAKKGKVTLAPGAYTYFCDVPGHRQAGMEGKLTVTAGAAAAPAPGPPAGATPPTVAATARAGAGGAISVTAENVNFLEKQLSVAAGKVHVAYINKDTFEHTLVFEGVPAFKLDAKKAPGKVEGDVTLSRGSYTYYCDIPGHRAAGMEGKLTVT
jgi:plastocyanin